MSEGETFDVKRILNESSTELKEKYPNAQTYLEQIALNKMQTHLTPSDISEISKDLLKKVNFRG